LGDSNFRQDQPAGTPREDASASMAVPAPARQGWQAAITATVTGLGYELVEVERAPRGLLRISIDRVPGRTYASRVAAPGEAPDTGEFVTVEDCEKVTRQLQYVLEVEGLDYARLEVGSPGLDRPLKTEADYARFEGQAVNLSLKLPFQGRKAWQGVLHAQQAGGWKLAFKDGKTEQELNFTFEEVREARLLPVVDFKGRKPRADAQASETTSAASSDANRDSPGATQAAPTEDGG
jgi:ribosome maturation factor RimP